MMSECDILEEFSGQTWKQRVDLIRDNHDREIEQLRIGGLVSEDEVTSFELADTLWCRSDTAFQLWPRFPEDLWERMNDRLSMLILFLLGSS